MVSARIRQFLSPLKWILAFGLLWVTIRSGKLDFGILKSLATNPYSSLLAWVLVLTNYALGFFRWKLLMGGQGLGVAYPTALRLGMIGQFLQLVAPGTTGADFTKGVYIVKNYPQKKIKGLSTVFLDRLIGLIGMVFLVATSYVLLRLSTHGLEASVGMRVLWSAGNIMLMVSATVIIVFAFLPKLSPWFAKRFQKSRGHLLHKTKWKGFFFRQTKNIWEMAHLYAAKSAYLWLTLGLSMMMHFLSLLVFWIIAEQAYGPAPWGDVQVLSFAFAVSMGLIVMALPISPMGLGVGQLAFAGIFHYLGTDNETMGASLVTAFQVFALSANLVGVVFFLKSPFALRRESEIPSTHLE